MFEAKQLRFHCDHFHHSDIERGWICGNFYEILSFLVVLP